MFRTQNIKEMKIKLLFIIALLLFTTIVKGQQNDFYQVLSPTERAEIQISQLKNYADAGWYIPAWDLLDYYFGNNLTGYVTHYANLIFPDSIVRYESSNGTINYNWMCAAGQVFDPTSSFYQQPLSPFQKYRIDSLFVYAWYNRVNLTSVDTLISEFVVGTPLTSPHFAHTIFIMSPDTLRVSPPRMLGDTTQKGYYAKLTAPDKIVVKYPLALHDSTTGSGKFIKFPVGIEVPAGKIIGVSMSFVPGYDYNFNNVLFSYMQGGTLTQEINSFRVGLFAVDNTTEYPSLFYDPFNRYNLSCYIHKKGRYKLYPEAWRNERMNPLITWGFDFGWKVSAWDNVSVESIQSEQLKIFPNPAANNLYIQINLIPEQITIYDTQGKVLFINKPQSTNETIDIAEWKPGLYFVEVITSSYTYKSKFIKL